MNPVTARDPSLMAHLAASSAAVKAQLDVALQQQSSGKISPNYAGLGTQVRTSLDLRPAIQHAQTWTDNIDRAAGRLDTANAVLKQVSDIAANFYAQTNNINKIGTSQVANIAVTARLALQQVAQALNTKVGDLYVFAGQDTSNPPVPNTDPDVVGAALLASDTATAPFSTTIGTAVPAIEVGDGQFVQTGVLANQNTLAASAAPTTGSYMRDVMRALATLATLTETTPGLEATAADVRTRLSSAISAMANESGSLGELQNSLATRRTALVASQTALSQQVSGAEDVDLAEVLTRVSALQTRLQSSYQVIAGVRDLALSKYL